MTDVFLKLATSRLTVGQKIVAFELNPFPDGRGGTAYNPVITLGNGAQIKFEVTETEDAVEYGVTPRYVKP